MRLALFAVLLALAGCARPLVRVEYVPVPAALLAPCYVDLGALSTNQELESALAASVLALKQCDADKRAIGALSGGRDSADPR